MLNRIALALCLAVSSACAPTIDATFTDAALVAAVKTALLNSTDIDGTLVTVSSQSGVVRLAGTQPTSEAAATVVRIVRSIDGVRDVQSSITIADAAPQPEPG
jgi:osmotically-inducible protein OsmY